MGVKIPNMFGKGYRTIPHELPSGQTAMFKPGAEMTPGKMAGVIGRGLGGRVSNQSPPFVKSRRVTNTGGMASAKAAARREELAMKRMKAHSKRRIGPLTEVEYVDDLFGKYK